METKPAIYTTEFWVHNIAMLGTILNLIGAWNFVPNTAVLWFQAIVTALYMLSRGIAKQDVPYTGKRSER